MPRRTAHELADPVFQEPRFAEETPTADPRGFQETHPSDSQIYKQIHDLLKKDVVPFDKSRIGPSEHYTLQEALGSRGPTIIEQIEHSASIVFHAFGDSGASNVRKYSDELRVADQVTEDAHTADPADRPSFLFHLGDVVYDFGESRYYYDQFYEPFRNYPAPIFSIPGNHDSFVVPGTPEGQEPLKIFSRNFCSPKQVITPEAGSLHRTAMTQPGVYFALDAPFVRIIGLFSNSLEDPGLISSEGGRWPDVPDFQLEFLKEQLKEIATSKYNGAVILAVHHPPFSYRTNDPTGADGNHSSSSSMLRQIDKICVECGVYPHAFLSAHAHNYQRYTRAVKFNGTEYDVPFIVCGDGGHNVNPLVRPRRGQPMQDPVNGSRVDYLENRPAVESLGLVLEKYDDQNYGYLRVSVDKERLRIGFHQVGVSTILQSRFDLVTVDLASHQLMANSPRAARAGRH
jgi:hypothetical protein